MAEVMQQPRDPEYLAREAGKQLYGTAVGMLRRAELWRLGNAWGMNFPDGCSKDYMLPFFKQLEADGKDPLRPPTGQNLVELVKSREVHHNDENHAAFVPENYAPDSEKQAIPALVGTPAPDEIKPAPISEFEEKLLKAPHAKLKQMCKLRGIKQERNDSKKTLVARILANVQNPPERS